jgi:hypothetical protein
MQTEQPLRCSLTERFLRILSPHTRAAAVLVDEFDAGGFPI